MHREAPSIHFSAKIEITFLSEKVEYTFNFYMLHLLHNFGILYLQYAKPLTNAKN